MNAFITGTSLCVIINHETLPFILIMSSLDKYNCGADVVVSDGSIAGLEEGVRYASYNLDDFYLDARDIYMAMRKIRVIPKWDRETKTFSPEKERKI